MDMSKISAGKDLPHDFNVVIEIPAQSDPVKYEVDKESGALLVDRFIGTSMRYPANYGFIPQTLGDDGDPVDVCVITPFPLPSARHAPDGRRKRRRHEDACSSGSEADSALQQDSDHR